MSKLVILLEYLIFNLIFSSINIMNKINENLSNNLLLKKIKTILFSIGFQEKYVAFEYLSIILNHLIINNDESINSYNQAIEIIKQNFNRTNRTILQSLNKILKTCSVNEINSKTQFNIINNSALNKIRVVKNFILTKLN